MISGTKLFSPGFPETIKVFFAQIRSNVIIEFKISSQNSVFNCTFVSQFGFGAFFINAARSRTTTIPPNLYYRNALLFELFQFRRPPVFFHAHTNLGYTSIPEQYAYSQQYGNSNCLKLENDRNNWLFYTKSASTGTAMHDKCLLQVDWYRDKSALSHRGL